MNCTEAPKNLQLTLSVEESAVFEGQEVTFKCKSTGATPPSVYSYGKLFTFFIEDNKLCKGLLTISVYIIQVKNIAGQQFKIKKKQV